jgi:hypothetical protein
MTYNDIYGIVSSAQGFTLSSQCSISSVKLKLKRTGSPGTLLFFIIRADENGVPYQSPVLLNNEVSEEFEYDTIDAFYPNWVTFDFSPTTLEAGTYCVGIIAASGDVSNSIQWEKDDWYPDYDGGVASETENVISEDYIPITADLLFKVYGASPISYDDIGAYIPSVSGYVTLYRSNEKYGQLFYANDDYYPTSLSLAGYQIGTPSGNLCAEILGYNSGVIGSVLYSGYIPCSSISLNYSEDVSLYIPSGNASGYYINPPNVYPSGTSYIECVTSGVETYLTTSGAEYPEYFDTAFTISGTSQSNDIAYLRVAVVAKNSKGISLYTDIGVFLEGQAYEYTVLEPTTDQWKEYYYDFAVNPYTSSSWTWDEVNDLKLGLIMFTGHDFGRPEEGWNTISGELYDVQVSKLSLEVHYIEEVYPTFITVPISGTVCLTSGTSYLAVMYPSDYLESSYIKMGYDVGGSDFGKLVRVYDNKPFTDYYKDMLYVIEGYTEELSEYHRDYSSILDSFAGTSLSGTLIRRDYSSIQSHIASSIRTQLTHKSDSKIMGHTPSGYRYDSDSSIFYPDSSSDNFLVGYNDYASGWISLSPASYVYVGSVSPPALHKTGFGIRFNSVYVPEGATIVSATIVLKEGHYSAGTKARITGAKEENPAGFYSLSDFIERRGTILGGTDDSKITTAQVDWDVEYDTTVYTPDIASVVNEILQNGWVSGNSMVFYIDDFDGRSDTRDDTWFYSVSSASKPYLVLTYAGAGSIIKREYGSIVSLSPLYSNQHTIYKIGTGIISHKADDGIVDLSISGTSSFYSSIDAIATITGASSSDWNVGILYAISGIPIISGDLSEFPYEFPLDFDDTQYYDVVMLSGLYGNSINLATISDLLDEQTYNVRLVAYNENFLIYSDTVEIETEEYPIVDNIRYPITYATITKSDTPGVISTGTEYELNVISCSIEYSWNQSVSTCTLAVNPISGVEFQPMDRIKVRQGYINRSFIETTFIGFIDTVTKDASTHSLTIGCRDILKLAQNKYYTAKDAKVYSKDFMPDVGSGGQSVADRQMESIISDFLTDSGIPEEYINIQSETTGITIGGINSNYATVFKYMNAMEAIQSLCDVGGYHLYSDITGMIRMRKIRPIASDNPQCILQTQLETPSEYSFTVNRIGNIYELETERDDESIRNYITVSGLGNLSATAVGVSPYIPSPPTYRKMEITTSYIDDADILAQTANDILTDLNRIRYTARAKIEGIPNLQIGDTVKVIDEYSTSAPGINYFVNSISSNMDESGYYMNLELVGGIGDGSESINNVSPVAEFEYKVVSCNGDSDLVNIECDATKSRDYNGDSLTYEWTCTGKEAQTGKVVTFEEIIGEVVITLTVTDNGLPVNLSNSVSRTVSYSNDVVTTRTIVAASDTEIHATRNGGITWDSVTLY